MTNQIAATMPVQAIADLKAMGGGSATKAPADAMGSDAFLKLLVAQLKYQDPSKPADGTALMGQTAQFQMVEKLQQLADQNTALLSEQQASSAIALVGRTITYTQGDKTLSGVVGSVRLTATGPVLAVGQTEVPMSSVTEISSIASQSSPAATPSSPAATPSSPAATPSSPAATPSSPAATPSSPAATEISTAG